MKIIEHPILPVSGLIIFFVGVGLDSAPHRFAYLVIHLGALIVLFSFVAFWMNHMLNTEIRKTKNSTRSQKPGFPYKDIGESIHPLIRHLASVVLVIILIFYTAHFATRRSATFQLAAETVKQDPAVLDKTGGIIGFSYLIWGESDDDSSSTYRFGIIGKRTNMKVRVQVIRGIRKTTVIIN